MKRVAIVAALAVIGVVVHALATERPLNGPAGSVVALASDDQEIAGIRKRIDELQGELDRLKGQLKALEAKRRLFVIPGQPLRQPGRSIPPDWERREFNGQEFYIVPLGKAPASGEE